jgi:hypothetical protein
MYKYIIKVKIRLKIIHWKAHYQAVCIPLQTPNKAILSAKHAYHEIQLSAIPKIQTYFPVSFTASTFTTTG